MSLRWKLHRLSAMSGREIAYRVRQRAQASMEQLGLGSSVPPAPMQERTGAAWVSSLPTRFDVDKYRRAADEILQGRFPVFAMPAAPLGFPPQWNRDPKTGRVAPLRFGKTLNYRDESLVGDIKYLWEPSRHAQLVTLAQAWHLTRERKYADGCRTLLESWFDQCPYPSGVHWTSSLEHAIRLLNWQHAYNFCDACGHKTEWFGGDWGKRCTNCGKTAYPPVSPAILVLIHDGDKILLTHKAGWGPRYSIIAGFIEPGESIEECVSREAYEEVGVEIDQITYFGSQSWPFPHQLMIGYMANYAGGEITIDAHELDDARWFHVDELPELPGPSSLSRQLINAWIRKYRPNAKQLLA